MAVAGMECEFVEKPPKAFQCDCPICLLVLREPCQATCCGKSFCKKCIHRIKAANQACPTCNDKDFTLFPNKGLQQSLYDFRVSCTHKSKGCEWTGELRELDNHLNLDPPADKSLQGCPFTLIKCPLSCVGCEKGVYRKDAKAHVSDQLLSKVVIQSAQIKALEQQLQHISLQFETRIKERVTELETKVSELSIQNGELKSEIKALKLNLPEIVSEDSSDQPTSKPQPVTHITGTYRPSGAKFTMTGFEEYQKDNERWLSPHFYTHPNGYKMCLGVYATGALSGKGTHLSVYVHVLQGEFDDQLKWPFRGHITVQLVNQEEDKDHVVNTTHFTSSIPHNCCKRVMEEGCRGSGRGCGQFLPLTELEPKYLKNDCIKLCIKRVELL